MNNHPDCILAQTAPGPLRGDLKSPGDKSISHRALIMASLAEGESCIEGLLLARDVEATAQACRQLGARIANDADRIMVKGLGKSGLTAPDKPLDMGNSGTAMRLFAGVLAAQPFDSVLVGDESLSSRPMNRIALPLREMGAVIETRENGCAPLRITGGRSLKGMHYKSPVASAQVKSCVLLAGLYASGDTSVVEPAQSRDHTERMLKAFGADISDDGVVNGGSMLVATDITVPSDISSAAFSMAAAAMVPGSRVMLRNVGLNPTRAGLIHAMTAMGCDVRVSNRQWFGVEPVGDIEIRWRPGIGAIELGADEIPAIIDEVPVLMALAARATGVTRIRGAGELRVKESDRIAVMADGLEALGFKVRQYPDGIEIEGKPVEEGGRSEVQAGNMEDFLKVDGAGDHRCAMSFCVLAQTLSQPVRVSGATHIDTSYPGFLDDLSALGGSVSRKEARGHES